MSTQYRIFRNTDPPALVEIWNEACVGRGSFPLRHANLLERWVFSKPFFDPNGVTIAEDDGRVIGFAHAGFGPNEEQTWLSPDVGVVCAMGVRPDCRRRGVGTQLLRHSEDYLRELGARQICAGAMRPYNPFYFGLYGGSDSPGFLNSDRDAAPFLEFNGYQGWQTTLVFQKKLTQPANVVDGRFAAIRRRFHVVPMAYDTGGQWWQECLLAGIEPVEFRLEDKLNGLPAARAVVWDMDGYGYREGNLTAGILDFQVRESMRRQGLGKYLMAHVLKFLQERQFKVCEVQAMERSQGAVGLFLATGFERVDAGRIYQKTAED